MFNDDVEVTHLESPAVVERDTTEAEAVLDRLEKIVQQQQMTTFDMAELLYKVKKSDLWHLRGYESFRDYINNAGFDFKVREAEYLAAVHQKTQMLEIPKADLVAAKISKLKIICQLNPMLEVKDEQTGEVELMADIIRKLIKDAPDKTLVEIKEIVKALLEKDTPRDEQLTWLNLPIMRSSKDVIERSLELARAMAGSTIDLTTKEARDIADASAMELIHADFIANPNNVVEDLGQAGDYEDEYASEPRYIDIDGDLYEEAD